MIGYESMTTNEAAERAQRVSRLGEFAIGVARDLQSLLLATAKYAEVLRAEAKEQSRHCRHNCDRCSSHLRWHAIWSIRCWSSLTSRVRERRLLSIGSLVREALPLMRAVVGTAGTLRLAIDAQAPLVETDPIAVQRALLNLVCNASRAIRQPDGVIEIGVTGMQGADGCSRFVRITVADNGGGMDDATLDNWRRRLADSPSASDAAGLGLGMVHRVVCSHGGRIRLDSQMGAGTTVRIDLPAMPRALRC
jgi:two-component system, cell cycle sensor histidine kinase and response regulator CckA